MDDHPYRTPPPPKVLLNVQELNLIIDTLLSSTRIVGDGTWRYSVEGREKVARKLERLLVDISVEVTYEGMKEP